MSHTDERKKRISLSKIKFSENVLFKIKDRSTGKYINLDVTRKHITDYRLRHLVCEICGQKDKVLNRNLTVDHDHSSNRFRGLLCTKCNMNYDWYVANHMGIKAYYDKNDAG